MIAKLPRSNKSKRSLPKGVYQYELEGGAIRYRWKAWGKGGTMDKQAQGYTDIAKARYDRHLHIYGHHWEGMPQDLDGLFGFTYVMEHIATGRKYIGSKQLLFWAGPVGGYKCTNPSDDEWFDPDLWKESDWKEYTSSSKVIKKMIKDEPWQFRYKVATLCSSKLDLHLTEIGLHIQNDVLHATDSSGNYKFLNENILGVEFRPPVPKGKLKVAMDEGALALRDYYLKPKVCEKCQEVIPYGQSRCPNVPLFGSGECSA